MMARPPKEEFFGLDMPFGEAMERYVGVKPTELEANVSKAKKKKPPGAVKVKPGGKSKTTNIISMKDRKTSLRKRGLA
jgi:hypothetical protein